MSLFYKGLLLGLFLGANLGIFVAGICVVAKRADEASGYSIEITDGDD